MVYLYFMKKQTLAMAAIPAAAEKQLKVLGGNIRNARKMRGMGMEELARRAMTTRETLRRLENGHSGVSLGVLAHVLWVLQLESSLGSIASVESDPQVRAYLEAGLPQRVRTKKQEPDYDF